MNWKRFGRKWHWWFSLEFIGRNWGILHTGHGRPQNRDLCLGPPECEVGVLISRPRGDVVYNYIGLQLTLTQKICKDLTLLKWAIFYCVDVIFIGHGILTALSYYVMWYFNISLFLGFRSFYYYGSSAQPLFHYLPWREAGRFLC